MKKVIFNIGSNKFNLDKELINTVPNVGDYVKYETFKGIVERIVHTYKGNDLIINVYIKEYPDLDL